MGTTPLIDNLRPKIEAGMPGIYLQSYEHEDAIEEILRMCSRERPPWKLALWDMDRGVSELKETPDGWTLVPVQPLLKTAVEAINHLVEIGHSEDGGESPPALLVLKNGHWLLNTPPIVQRISNAVWDAKTEGRHLLMLSPLIQLPPELEKRFVIVEHELPEGRQLLEIARGVATEPGELPQGDELDQVVEAAKGLTRFEAENAFAESIARHGRLVEDTIFECKAQSLKKGNQAVQLDTTTDTLDTLGGLKFLKQFCRELLSKRESNPRFRPRGIMLLGPPGTGKTTFARCLGNEVGRPTLLADLGAARGGIQGQTEAWTREMFRKADAMAPCILFIDEFEKLVAGSKSTGVADGGTSARQVASTLHWMSEHESDVFVIVTCNDIHQLAAENPEFVRAGRFDGLFFMDFPDRESKDEIWRIHLRNYELLAEGQDVKDMELPEDGDWTGAEIENCCRLARLRGRTIAEIGEHIPTVAKQAEETIEHTREWASGRCWAADVEGIYCKQRTRTRAVSASPRRRVDRKKQELD